MEARDLFHEAEKAVPNGKGRDIMTLFSLLVNAIETAWECNGQSTTNTLGNSEKILSPRGFPEFAWQGRLRPDPFHCLLLLLLFLFPFKWLHLIPASVVLGSFPSTSARGFAHWLQRLCPGCLVSGGLSEAVGHNSSSPQERLACSFGFIPPKQPLLFSRNGHPSVLTVSKTKVIMMLVCKPKHTSLSSLHTHQTGRIDLRAPSLLTNNKMGGLWEVGGMGSGHRPSSLPWPCVEVTFPYT